MNVGLTEVEVVHSSLHEDRILVYVPKGKRSLPYKIIILPAALLPPG